MAVNWSETAYRQQLFPIKSFVPGDWKVAVCLRQVSLRMHFHALKAQHGTHGGQAFRDMGFRVTG